MQSGSPSPHPAELRTMFGRNLRILSKSHKSVSSLCRDLGINRTQFNRYLSGESFPRPDVLARICDFFKVDARILLEPLGSIKDGHGVLNHPFLQDYIGIGAQNVADELFPTGFYRFSRQSFIEKDLLVTGLVLVFREAEYVFVRGYEPRNAMRKQGLPMHPRRREFRGVVTPQDDGVSFSVAHVNNGASTFNYLSRVATFQNGYWVGYTARPCRETISGRRVTRMVYEHLNQPFAEIMAIARTTGYASVEDLPPFHAQYLRIDSPFD